MQTAGNAASAMASEVDSIAKAQRAPVVDDRLIAQHEESVARERTLLFDALNEVVRAVDEIDSHPAPVQ